MSGKYVSTAGITLRKRFDVLGASMNETVQFFQDCTPEDHWRTYHSWPAHPLPKKKKDAADLTAFMQAGFLILEHCQEQLDGVRVIIYGCRHLVDSGPLSQV